MSNLEEIKKIDVPCLSNILKTDDDKVVTTAPYSHHFGIGNRYTGQFDVARGETVLWTIPKLEYIKDKMKLRNILWLPFSKDVEERLVLAQIEFYQCWQTIILEHKNWSIMLPLRVFRESPANPFAKLENFEIPTFKLDEITYLKLLAALGNLDHFHFFTFYAKKPEPDQQSISKTLVFAVQVLH